MTSYKEAMTLCRDIIIFCAILVIIVLSGFYLGFSVFL